MVQRSKPQHIVLDSLKIVWLLSLIPWAFEIAKATPGFPDIAPTYTPAYWLAFGGFGILQLTVTAMSWYRNPLTISFIIPMIISTLLLVVEEFVGFFVLMFLYTFVAPIVLILAIILVIRLAKQL